MDINVTSRPTFPLLSLYLKTVRALDEPDICSGFEPCDVAWKNPSSVQKSTGIKAHSSCVPLYCPLVSSSVCFKSDSVILKTLTFLVTPL